MATGGELGGEFGDRMFAVENAGGGDNSAAPPPAAATSTKRKLSKSSSSRPHIIGTDDRVQSSAAAPSAAAATKKKKRHRVYKQRQPREKAVTARRVPFNRDAKVGAAGDVSASAGATRKPLRMNTVSVIAESVPDPGTTEDMVLKERDRFVADAEQGRATLPVSAQQQLPPGGTGVNARYVKRKVKRLKRPNEDMATYLASLTARGVTVRS